MLLNLILKQEMCSVTLLMTIFRIVDNGKVLSYIASSLTSSPQSYSNLDILAAISLKELSSINRLEKRNASQNSTPYEVVHSKERKLSLDESTSAVVLNA